MSGEIVNKIAQSGLITLDLESFYPSEEIVEFDLKPFLFMEMILKEKDFRNELLQHNWDVYKDKMVAVYCSADAIIPYWAYMLVTSYLTPVASKIVFGNKEQVIKELMTENIRNTDTSLYTDKRVILKGCGKLGVTEFAYLEISKKLLPVVKTLMYGEACSTVPVYKKR